MTPTSAADCVIPHPLIRNPLAILGIAGTLLGSCDAGCSFPSRKVPTEADLQELERQDHDRAGQEFRGMIERLVSGIGRMWDEIASARAPLPTSMCWPSPAAATLEPSGPAS